MVKSPKAHFDIDASIVFQLGEDLITDVVQALIELVKNSYDADSEYAKVTVDTNGGVPELSSFFPDARGYILIEDNGIGMHEETIKRGWLTISNSPKRELKKKNETTELGRTPLGDKGLGRLGAQRLGFNIEIFTQPKGDNRVHHVGWSWHDFRGDITLTTVPVKWEILNNTHYSGTKILISELREPEQWESTSYKKIETALSQMISPYSQFRDFEVIGSFNGKELHLAEVSNRVRNSAQIRYQIQFDEKAFLVKGKARLEFLRPNSKKDSAIFEQLVEDDDGESFYEFLSNQKRAAQFLLKRARGKDWFVEFGYQREFDDIDQIARENIQHDGHKAPISPGPFFAEVDAFNLGATSIGRQSTFDTMSEYRKLIKDLSGIRIYRDGFGIRAEQDWLGLGKQWTAGGSYYGLKPENTLGFVALTARENAALVETTDREGFKDTPAYRNFLRLFEIFVLFAHDAQEFLRRSWSEFRKEHESELAGIEPEATAENLANTLSLGLQKVNSYKKPIEKVQNKLNQVLTNSEKTINGFQKKASADPSLVKELEKSKTELNQRIDEVQTMLKLVLDDFESVSKLQEINKVLSGKIEHLQNQLELGVEAMSLGLTTEVLSHEIANIVDQLADRTKAITAYLSRKKIADTKILTYVEHIRTTTNGLRQQLGHLTPSLKFARTSRTKIDLIKFCENLAEYHQSRWQNYPINLAVRIANPFTIKINQGKLTQVFDNLIINSDYWLKEDLEAGRIDKGIITIRISEPHIVISDNGRGIDPSIEAALFEPSVSHKKNGRGLGLYVSQQLLDSEGCSIKLRSRRNSNNRFYQFELDLSGCLIDGVE